MRGAARAVVRCTVGAQLASDALPHAGAHVLLLVAARRWEKLRRLAFADDVDEPEQLALILEEARA